jgi:predicted nucleotide-binding protein
MNTANKFDGDDGRRLLIDALSDQKVVNGNIDVAEALADVVNVRLVPAGETIIVQGAEDHSLYMILSGSFDVRVNNKTIARRWPQNTVGEMAAILPTQLRSASVTAAEPSWVAELSESDLTRIADKHPFMWRFFAKELARRLLERNTLLNVPREKVRVLIISSAEALDIARAIQSAFEHDPFLVYPWSDGVFKVAQYPVENLEAELNKSDFAIAIVAADDVTTSRKRRQGSPRDNVIFELGFFMGRLGRHRAVLLEPKGASVKLPSDLTGIQTIKYVYEPGPDMAAELAPACNKLRAIFKDLGPYI